MGKKSITLGHFVERRQEYRLPFDQKVLLTDGKIAKTAYASNISRGGLFLMTLDPFPIGTTVHLAFMIPQQPMSLCLKGKIAHIVYDRQRCEVECGMGVQCLELSEAHKSALNLHILNGKMAYLELKKLLTPAKPNLVEVERILKKVPSIKISDLSALRYRVNRICTIFEPTPDPFADGREQIKQSA